jgi:hypothetical protein
MDIETERKIKCGRVEKGGEGGGGKRERKENILTF